MIVLGATLAACHESRIEPADSGSDAGSPPARCDSDRDCSAFGLLCDVGIARCVDCRDASDCAAGEVCLVGACAAPTSCSSSRECPGLVCDPALGRCVECLGDVDCDTALRCDSGRCRPAPGPCTSDSECAGGARCDVASGACVECLGDADCAAPLVCTSAGRCSDPACTCASDADCDDGVFCNGAETCAGCVVGCVAGAPPCAGGAACEEEGDRCTSPTCERPVPYFRDADGDGWGDGADRLDACAPVPGRVRAPGDCADASAARHPGAMELCDGSVDEDCDRAVDEGCTCVGGESRVCGSDVGACARGMQICSGTWGTCGGLGPSPETCNGEDDDCDGTSDESPDVDRTFGAGSCVGGACTMLRPVALGLGQNDSFAVMSDGTVRRWGGGPPGGGGVTTARSVDSLRGAVAIDASRDGACAVLADGGLACATICSSCSPSFTRVAGVVDAIDVTMGDSHTCYVRSSGRVMCWGWGSSGQLGDGTTMMRATPVEVLGLSDAIDVSAGTNVTCAVRASGRVLCWGYGRDGNLGNGTSPEYSAVPVEVTGIDDAIAVGVSHAHACARRAAGTIQCWGNGDYGALGNGSTSDRSTPVTFMAPSGSTLPAQLAGVVTCAIRPDRHIVCAGHNGQGELGDGTGAHASIPVEVSTIDDAITLEGGSAHWCAIRADGSVWCWGSNSAGELGDGGRSFSRTTPVRVLDLPPL